MILKRNVAIGGSSKKHNIDLTKQSWKKKMTPVLLIMVIKRNKKTVEVKKLRPQKKNIAQKENIAQKKNMP